MRGSGKVNNWHSRWIGDFKTLYAIRRLWEKTCRLIWQNRTIMTNRSVITLDNSHNFQYKRITQHAVMPIIVRYAWSLQDYRSFLFHALFHHRARYLDSPKPEITTDYNLPHKSHPPVVSNPEMIPINMRVVSLERVRLCQSLCYLSHPALTPHRFSCQSMSILSALEEYPTMLSFKHRSACVAYPSRSIEPLTQHWRKVHTASLSSFVFLTPNRAAVSDVTIWNNVGVWPSKVILKKYINKRHASAHQLQTGIVPASQVSTLGHLQYCLCLRRFAMKNCIVANRTLTVSVECECWHFHLVSCPPQGGKF